MEVYLTKTSGMITRYMDIPCVYPGLYEFPFSILQPGSYAIITKRDGDCPKIIGWIDKGRDEWASVREPVAIITEDFKIIQT